MLLYILFYAAGFKEKKGKENRGVGKQGKKG